MTVEVIRPRSFESALNRLSSLSTIEEYVFRGQSRREHRLQTSLERYWSVVPAAGGPFAGYPVNKFISQYRDGLARIRLHPIRESAAWLDWLEHARHYGVPAPLLDFSWSPYVALFFAYNRVRDAKRGEASNVYALNTARLARHWMLRQTTARGPECLEVARRFEKLQTVIPDDIRFIREPGVYAERMQRQLGAFLYCTLDYASRGLRDLEDYLDRINEACDAAESATIRPSNGPVLTKVVFRHAWAKDAFERLELMNIKGATLFLSADGVAHDIWNGYHYIPKAVLLRRRGAGASLVCREVPDVPPAEVRPE